MKMTCTCWGLEFRIRALGLRGFGAFRGLVFWAFRFEVFVVPGLWGFPFGAWGPSLLHGEGFIEI